MPGRASAKQLRGAVAGILAALFPFQYAAAHPMGNFSINHYTGIRIGKGQVELRYIIDMAEIPAYQEMQEKAIPADAQDARVRAWLAARVNELVRGLRLRIGATDSSLRILSETIAFPPGAGNLPTLRLSFLSSTVIPADCAGCEIFYQDTNFPGRAGWKEIVTSGSPGVSIIASTVPAQDRSNELANYQAELLNSPPQDLEARVIFAVTQSEPEISSAAPSARPRPARRPEISPHKPARQDSHSQAGAVAEERAIRPPSPPAGSPPVVQDSPISRASTPRNAFTELLNSPQTGLAFMLAAALIAASLGALHALEPGHGKTLVAAYLVGSRGTARHAFALGLIVTVSHTAGVYLLGLLTMYAQKYVLPERTYPFLALLSGIFIAGMGLYLFLQRALPGIAAHVHSHGPAGAAHSHGGFWHSHVYDCEHTHSELQPVTSAGGVSRPQLWLLGVTGGMIPCPAALVVLLGAAAMHRTGFGLFLIVSFSAGLAAVLIAIGLIAVYARGLMGRMQLQGPLVQRWLPMISAGLITIVGCALAIRSLATAGVLRIGI